MILSYLGENTDKNKKTNLKYSNISLLYDTLQGNGFQKEPPFFQGLIFRCHANLQGLSQECEKKTCDFDAAPLELSEASSGSGCRCHKSSSHRLDFGESKSDQTLG